MAVNIPAGGEEEDAPMATINTTPLVDIMLVLLIIFLITIPVVITVIPVSLPQAENRATQTKPQDVSIAINADGQVFWNLERVADMNELLERFRPVASTDPQPEVHIRADKETRFENVGRVILTVQRAGILKMAFVTEPPARD